MEGGEQKDFLANTNTISKYIKSSKKWKTFEDGFNFLLNPNSSIFYLSKGIIIISKKRIKYHFIHKLKMPCRLSVLEKLKGIKQIINTSNLKGQIFFER